MGTNENLKVSVIVVDDDLAIRRMLASAFSDSEFKFNEADCVETGLTVAAKCKPELVVLDLGLPDADGVEFIKRFREWSSAPILVLSAADDEDRKVDALNNGADDYVTKPFGVGELLARLRSHWRRMQLAGTSGSEPTLVVGDVTIDLETRQVVRNGEAVRLTPTEYNLLVFLAKHSGKVVTQRQILAAVWGEEYSEDSQYLRIYVGYLRKKLEDDPANPTLILTEPRVGYRIRG